MRPPDSEVPNKANTLKTEVVSQDLSKNHSKKRITPSSDSRLYMYTTGTSAVPIGQHPLAHSQLLARNSAAASNALTILGPKRKLQICSYSPQVEERRVDAEVSAY